MKNTIGKAAIDIGNDSIKSLFESPSNQILIPNLVAEIGINRNVKEYEKDVLDGIHIEITSGALKRKHGVYAVGNLAKQQHNYSELAIHSKKCENDQSLILLLTSLAINAVQSGIFSSNEEIIEAKYYLSTGLPILEATLDERKQFRDKLQKNTHEIRFLQTPLLQGKTVRITFEKVFVNLEGLASFINLSKNNEELIQQEMMIIDIGGLTTDVAVIQKATVNNTMSTGYSEGVSPYLDRIINRVRSEIGYPIKTRKDIVEIIINNNPTDKNHVYVYGNRTCVSHIVEEELMKLARKQYYYMLDIWNQVPSLRIAYFVGGGAIVLKDYLEAIINKEDKNFPIRFLRTNDSIWSMAESYFSILETWLNTLHKENINNVG
ncbi:ParM/StbA family protein [Fictibacillus barbaricus]|uniref:Plasmid segregation protein ParM n=1 Tax=Fictibacillus barbaricus TaxID=182136 RepID=A0ABU1U5H6_9BACL|nr:ParM/StbA family protein [Fictibacillus barbaricus]MDR7074739.1 plasmid segregation protein ParM [Fictibacillus barbaricus]